MTKTTATMARKSKLRGKTAAVLDPVRPNVGVQALYERRLVALVDGMARDAARTILRGYERTEPVIAREWAEDASPAMELRELMRKFARKWIKRFDDAAPEIATWFAKQASDRTDAAFQAILRKAGFTVRFKMTAAQNDAYQAVIGQNIALIHSLGSEYATQLEGIVMRGVAAGRKQSDIAKSLEHQHGVSKRRAAFIARDQNNKATAVLTRTRQKELGIKKARWLHSQGGRVPRPEHVAFSGKIYDIEKGAYLEGVWTWPGMEINCRCVSQSVIEGFDDD